MGSSTHHELFNYDVAKRLIEMHGLSCLDIHEDDSVYLFDEFHKCVVHSEKCIYGENRKYDGHSFSYPTEIAITFEDVLFQNKHFNQKLWSQILQATLPGGWFEQGLPNSNILYSRYKLIKPNYVNEILNIFNEVSIVELAEKTPKAYFENADNIRIKTHEDFMEYIRYLHTIFSEALAQKSAVIIYSC